VVEISELVSIEKKLANARRKWSKEWLTKNGSTLNHGKENDVGI
jgi:hypothetical protein